MSNVNDSDTGRKAEHRWINEAGEFVEKQERASGISYVDKATGEAFTFQIPGAAPGTVQTMLAGFGAKTLATNTASQARQQGLPEVAAIRVRFEEDMKDDQWNSPADRSGGPRIDIENAILAIEEVLTSEGKDTSRVRLRADEAALAADFEGKLVGIEYLRAALKNPKVSAAYAKLRGKAAPDTADLA